CGGGYGRSERTIRLSCRHAALRSLPAHVALFWGAGLAFDDQQPQKSAGNGKAWCKRHGAHPLASQSQPLQRGLSEYQSGQAWALAQREDQRLIKKRAATSCRSPYEKVGSGTTLAT